MHSRYVIVDQNLEVRLDGICQFRTYAGLLEGTPSTVTNARTIDYFKKRAEQLFNCQEETVCLIPPVETLIETSSWVPFGGQPATLPSIVCIAELYAPLKVFRDLDKDCSRLIVIWFQEDYAFPIAEDILSAFKNIPYRAICEEDYM